MTLTYRIALVLAQVLVRGYGALRVHGTKHIPRKGPVLIVANHDSPLDAFIVGVAARQHRQVRFLTKRSLWRSRLLGSVLNNLHQIPIERGQGEASGLDGAIAALRAGHCVCIFPEGTLSRGQRLRIRGGAARLLAAVPGTTIVGCAVTGSTKLLRLRFRARVRVVFFAQLRDTASITWESATACINDTMEIVRRLAPPAS